MEITFEKTLGISDEQKSDILPMLPNYFQTKVTSYSRSTQGFCMEIRVNIYHKVDALKWKTKFEELTRTTYNPDSTYEENTQRTVFKCVYHCLHNTRPKAGTISPHYKHTNCPAKMIINVKQSGMKRSKDIYLKTLPCQISLRYEHNHSINFADELLHRKFSTTEKSVQLFTNTQSVSVECMELLVESNVTQENVDQAKSNLRNAFNTILDKLKQNPCTYLQPINKFCELIQEVQTDSSMVSALQTFGKYSSLSQNKNNQGGRKIGVKSMSVGQRKLPLGDIKIALSGRPLENHKEHVYVKRKRIKATDLSPAKQPTVPQSVSQIIVYKY